MKTKRFTFFPQFKSLFLLLIQVFFILHFVNQKNQVFACTEDCYPSACDYHCSDCSWCQPSPPKIKNPLLPNNLQNATSSEILNKTLSAAVNIMLAAGGIAFFIMLLYGGIKWITSGGDKAKLESAQKQITSALVGLAILLSAFAIIKLIESIFGIKIQKITLPKL